MPLHRGFIFIGFYKCPLIGYLYPVGFLSISTLFFHISAGCVYHNTAFPAQIIFLKSPLTSSIKLYMQEKLGEDVYRGWFVLKCALPRYRCLSKVIRTRSKSKIKIQIVMTDLSVTLFTLTSIFFGLSFSIYYPADHTIMVVCVLVYCTICVPSTGKLSQEVLSSCSLIQH